MRYAYQSFIDCMFFYLLSIVEVLSNFTSHNDFMREINSNLLPEKLLLKVHFCMDL